MLSKGEAYAGGGVSMISKKEERMENQDFSLVLQEDKTAESAHSNRRIQLELLSLVFLLAIS